MKHYSTLLTITLLSAIVLAPHVSFCMDPDSAAQDAAPGPLIEISSQDLKNLEETIQALSRSEDFSGPDSHAPVASAAQQEEIADIEMWLTGRYHWVEPDGIIVLLDE